MNRNSIFPSAGWGTSKPPAGSSIDWSHPLAKGMVGCWLFNEGGGRSAINRVNFKKTTSFHSALAWVGGGLRFATDWVDQITLDYYPSGLVAQTYLFVCNITDPTSNPLLYEKGTNNVFKYLTTNTRLVYFRDYTTTDKQRYVNTNPALFATGQHVFAVTDDGTTAWSGTHIYLDGVDLPNNYSQNGVGTIADDSAMTLIFGTPMTGMMRLALIWNRALSQAEIQTFSYAPYCFVDPVSTRNYFDAGGAPPATSIPVMMATYRRRRTA